MKKKYPPLHILLALLISSIFSIFGILINVNRFWQYESGQYDLGIFDSAIWNVSRFQPPIIEHLILGGKLIFADHFSPSYYLLSPFYWITSRTEMLFIAQDIAVGASGFILFLIAVHILKNKVLPFAVLIAYFLYVGLQNAITFDFHELTIMTVFLALVYWTVVHKRKKLFFLFFFLMLGFKETLFLLGIGLSIFIFFYQKDWKKIAVTAFFISVAWGALTILVLIPHFSEGLYIYKPDTSKGILDLFLRLFTPIIKLKSVTLSLLSFLFLPLLAPQVLPILLLNYSARFLTAGAEHWDLGLHYNAEIAPTLAMGAILGLNSIKNKLNIKAAYGAGIVLVLVSVLLYRFILHGPFGLAYNPAFYNHTKDFKFLDRMIAVVPKDATVMAQNNLLARFAHQKSWLLQDSYKKKNPDYILFDVRPGQNPYALYQSYESINHLLEVVKNDKEYKLIYHDGDQYVFKKMK